MHRDFKAALTDDAHRRWHLAEALEWLSRDQASYLDEASNAFDVLEPQRGRCRMADAPGDPQGVPEGSRLHFARAHHISYFPGRRLRATVSSR